MWTEHAKAVLMLLVVTLAWASSFILIKVGLKEIPPVTFAAVRFVIASAFLLFAFSLTDKTPEVRRIHGFDWVRFLVLGLSGVALLNLLQFIGLSLTTAVSASVLLNMNPVFTAMLSAVFLHEKMNLRKVAGILAAFLGMLCVATNLDVSAEIFSSAYILGNVLVLGSALCWSVYTVLGKSMFGNYSPITVTVISINLGTPFLLALALVSKDVSVAMQISATAWLSLILLALVCSGLAYMLWYEALNILEASRTSVFLFTMPIYTMLIANLTLGEAITGPMILGTALVILGVYLTETA